MAFYTAKMTLPNARGALQNGGEKSEGGRFHKGHLHKESGATCTICYYDQEVNTLFIRPCKKKATQNEISQKPYRHTRIKTPPLFEKTNPTLPKNND